MANQYPLRERRKAATRRELIRSANELFALKGYEQTTLEEIAAHAGLHVQTLYRHFANKVELATASDVEALDRFRVAIRSSERTDSTFQFWREWVRDAVTQATASDGGQLYREFLHVQWGPPLIPSQLIRNAQGYEDLLAESLTRDFKRSLQKKGIAPSRMAAIALLGANGHVLRRYAQNEGVDLVAESVRAVDGVESLFKPYLKVSG
ncbi:MAG: TetR/AcrR family transcriptional regulator [Pseudomonadales bacterium]